MAAEARLHQLLSKLDGIEGVPAAVSAARPHSPVHASTSPAHRSSRREQGATTSAAEGADEGPGVASICHGMRIARRDSGPSTSSRPRFGRPAEQMPAESLRKMLHDAESMVPLSAKMARLAARTSSSKAEAASAEPPKSRGSRIELPPVTYTCTTFAQALHELPNTSETLDGGMTTEQRLSRKQQQEELRARKKASRMERQLVADEARVAFGMTSKEKRVGGRPRPRVPTQPLPHAAARGAHHCPMPPPPWPSHTMRVGCSAYAATPALFALIWSATLIGVPPTAGSEEARRQARNAAV
jgi:hypothetical protein